MLMALKFSGLGARGWVRAAERLGTAGRPMTTGITRF